jgi:hypothetical protein
MSRTVDLFIDSDCPLESLAEQLGDLLGERFAPLPDGARFALRKGPVTVYLAEHDFLDDEGLPLSEFRYVLSARVRGAGDIEQSPEAGCLRRLKSLWSEQAGLASLLVFDLERAEASEGEGCWQSDLGARQ